MTRSNRSRCNSLLKLSLEPDITLRARANTVPRTTGFEGKRLVVEAIDDLVEDPDEDSDGVAGTVGRGPDAGTVARPLDVEDVGLAGMTRLWVTVEVAGTGVGACLGEAGIEVPDLTDSALVLGLGVAGIDSRGLAISVLTFNGGLAGTACLAG